MFMIIFLCVLFVVFLVCVWLCGILYVVKVLFVGVGDEEIYFGR